MGVVLVLVACRFEPGVLAGDAGWDAPVDGPAPTGDVSMATGCTDRWLAGPTLGAPRALDSVNTTGAEADPFVTSDELALYFVRTSDIYRATRTTPDDDWSTPVRDDELSSPQSDSKVSFTADGLTAYLNSGRPGGSGGGTDVWRATRTSADYAFVIDQVALGAVNTSGDQWDPHISADGTRLYLAPGGTGNPQTIEVASRTTPTADFGPAQVIVELDSGEVDNDPTLSGDERVIVFASNRGGNRDLWYAVRATPQDAFGAPQRVPDINTATEDGAHLSFDGCRLYFASDRSGNADLYVVDIE